MTNAFKSFQTFQMYKSFNSLKQVWGYEYHIRESSRLQSRSCCIQEHFQWIMQLAGTKWLSHSCSQNTVISLHLSGALDRSHARHSHTLCAPIQVHNCKHSLQRTNYKTITHSMVWKYTNPIKAMLQTPTLGKLVAATPMSSPLRRKCRPPSPSSRTPTRFPVTSHSRLGQ